MPAATIVANMRRDNPRAGAPSILELFGVTLPLADSLAGDPASPSNAVVVALAAMLALAVAVALACVWPWRVAVRRRRAALAADIALRLRASALHAAVGDMREAAELARQALAASVAARMRPEEAVARECVADAHFGAGAHRLAVEGWQASLAMARGLDMHAAAARLCRKLAQACEADGAARDAARWKYRAAILEAKAQDSGGGGRRRRAAQARDVPDLPPQVAQVAQAAVQAARLAAAGRMLASVNHELKQPLASMRLLASNGLEMLDDGRVDRARKSLADLLVLADQLADVTSALDTFARREPARTMEARASDCVRAALRVVAPQVAHARAHRIVWGGDDDARIWSDPDRVRLILVNLISNAIDATADSPNKRIEVRVRDEGEWVTLCVRDYGSGLPAQAGRQLFEPFATSKPQGRGLGLGLALSARLAREMRGRLSGRNHSRGGAEFVLRLPARAPAG